MKTRISVQERLWELRKDKGLNLEELAQQTGISKSALASYEDDARGRDDLAGAERTGTFLHQQVLHVAVPHQRLHKAGHCAV